MRRIGFRFAPEIRFIKDEFSIVLKDFKAYYERIVEKNEDSTSVHTQMMEGKQKEEMKQSPNMKELEEKRIEAEKKIEKSKQDLMSYVKTEKEREEVRKPCGNKNFKSNFGMTDIASQYC